MSNNLLAQESQIELAMEYFNRGEYEKAKEYFDDLAKDDENIDVIYDRYLHTLAQLNDEKESKQFLKKLNRKYPENLEYQIDEIFLERVFGQTSLFEKELRDFINRYTKENSNLRLAANVLIKKREYQWAEELYLTGRKNNKNDFAYVQELLTIYRASGNEDGVLRESINMLKVTPQNVNYVQNILQSFINIDNYEKLERELIRLMQKDTDGTFNLMLIWTYVQVKQFDNAFIQAKALDRRFNLYGTELIDLGKICFENKFYQTAIDIYAYVVEKYPNSENYAIARQKLIETREEIIKNTYPVPIDQIRVLISDYSDLIKELGLKRTTAEAMRKMAMLYAFYLHENDSAILILNRAISTPRTNHDFVGNCKLNLGDIYLLKDEPWESILLYSQVDKSYKEQTIGQEAKLSLARLYFYQGDFQLAQDNLDILKLATTREIANDAMDLSLLIQDNLALDTSDLALSRFSKIELLKFQQNLDSAEKLYKKMLVDFPNHSLCDEIFWNMAFVHLKKGEVENAVKDLDEIIIKYKSDIYGDDALFMKADLLDKQLDRKEEAMELYKQILFDFPGSIYNAESRKRYRELRGDYQ